jgi:hypothetical protein
MAKLTGWKRSLLAFLLGLPFAGMGAFLGLQGFGLMRLTGDLYAPRWVLVPIGILLLLPGLGLWGFAAKSLSPGSPAGNPRPAATGAFVAIMLSAFSVVLLAGAFKGDPRGFYGGIPGMILDKRIVIGLAGLLVGAFAGVFWVFVFASRGKPRSDVPSDKGGS